MTVISRKVHNYNNPSSNNASDTESLNLGSTAASDSESLHSEPTTSRQVRLANVVLKADDVISSRAIALGKRKQRRYLNRSILQTLNEEEEDATGYVKLADKHKTPLTRLLEDETALHFWNDFIHKSEEEQEEFLKNSNSGHKKEVLENPKINTLYFRISSKIRRMLKIKRKLPIDLLQKIETDLLDFFTSSSTGEGVYILTPNSSFERLLLHGISQYHGLTSLSVVMDGTRSVEVYKTKSDWAPNDMSFCKFVEELRR
ncbi:R3H domain-containing protein 4 isoform X1 [Agrilus planipennis]|uniref:R3H domain-containing protein 4 isoform X1 n=1 Tax=Agrilus planipennis TaxID=224129 RepID=A0A1W4WR79_AGRPL|nr:R3H domain-containing protein 4 isoform X1 [Agrilus planipennis]